MMHAQKDDKNDDGVISLDELNTRQHRRFAQLDRDKNGMIEKRKLNVRMITMFYLMDGNGDGVLRGNELPSHIRGSKKHQQGNESSDPTENS